MMMAAEKIQTVYDISVSDDADHAVREAIEAGIDSFSDEAVGQERKACYVLIRDGGRLIGGLRGESLGSVFYIKHLWVDEGYRNTGLGIEMMDKVEKEARDRGCKTIWVDTLSYQAPGFYAKAGYDEISKVPGYRGAHDRIFFRKDL